MTKAVLKANKENKHDFIVNRGNTSTYIQINYDKKIIVKYKLTNTKDGSVKSDEHTVFNFAPVEISESYNILDPNAKPKLSFTFKRKGSPQVQTITSNNISNIVSSLENRSALVSVKKEARDTLNSVISEYQNQGLLKVVEDIPIAGIFVNPKTNKLVRSGEDGEIKITKPPRAAVKKALKVWSDLHDVYPGDSKKLSHILRYGLLSPFSYIFKTDYAPLEYLFLYGASRVAKTTLAEISLSPYATIDDTVSIGGGAFDTPYRIGHALEKHGFGVIVNEPGATLQNGDCIEIIKRSNESAISREKWDQNEHIQIPSYSNIIFTSNAHLPTEDSLIRRGQIIEFTSKERLDEDDVKKFERTFNYSNKHQNRFNDLKPIGDYIIWYTSQNLGMLSKDKKEIVDEWLDSLLEYAGEKKMMWNWLYQEAELMDIQEADDEIKNIFINTLNHDYRSTPINMYEDYTSLESEKEAFKKNWKRILGRRFVTYAELHEVNGIDYVFINSQIKNRVKERTGKSISCKSFSDIIGGEYKAYNCDDKTKRGFRIKMDDFVDIFY